MLRMDSVSKVFNPGSHNEVRALQNISLDVKEGEFVVLIGTNGSGKSSLLNAIAGTFFLDSGLIHIGGEDMSGLPEHKRAPHVGRVFQDPFTGTAPGMSVIENIALATRRGLSRTFGKAITTALRAEVAERLIPLGMNLEDRLDAPIRSLSGGQRQALTLLMATWRKPDVLLLDEHTAALDPKNAEKVLQLSEEIVHVSGITTLMVTHSMKHAAQLGGRLLMMHRGEILREFRDAEKQRLRPYELEERFAEIRQTELLDESAAALIEGQYV